MSVLPLGRNRCRHEGRRRALAGTGSRRGGGRRLCPGGRPRCRGSGWHPTRTARFVADSLDASIGDRLNGLSVNLGIGDLLVFRLFALAATREHGRRGGAAALTAIASFGALTPVLLPAVLHFGGTDGGFVIPAQAFFGPAAALAYLWLARTTVTPHAELVAGQTSRLP